MATWWLAVMAASAFASDALAGPAVATRYTEPGRWKDAPATQETCLARAEAALVATGFANVERTQQSRYGSRGDYTGIVRCILDKEIVFVVVSGPSRQTSDEGAGVLFQNFEKAR